MIQEEFTLKHVNFLTSENPGRVSWAEQSRDSRMATSQWNFLRSSLMSCSKSLRSLGKVTTTGLKPQALPEDQKAQCDKVIHQNSGQLLENFFGWLSSEMTSSIPSRSSQDHSSIPKIRTSKISFTCSSMSIRQETLSLSWSLSFQSGIKKASFQFRLSAIQIQIGQVVKNQGSQRVVHWFQYQCQSSVNQQNSSFNCSFLSRK